MLCFYVQDWPILMDIHIDSYPAGRVVSAREGKVLGKQGAKCFQYWTQPRGDFSFECVTTALIAACFVAHYCFPTGPSTILKEDHFPGMQKKYIPQVMIGAPNFR